MDNGPLIPVLSRIVDRIDAETEWLDLLSQLEYVGCRKILRSLPYADVNHAVLRHVYEEASHAFFLKELVTARGRTESWATNRFSPVGWEYFQTLDEKVSEAQKGEGASAYPAVAWTIEQRVLSVYPIYLELTQDPQVKRTLQRILAQEKRHAREFEAEGFSSQLREVFLHIEDELWLAFCRRMEALV